MNPYEVDIEKLKESHEIKGTKELLKLRLVTEFLKVTKKMQTDEILNMTGLHKSDLSRLRALNVDRFTIDRLVSFLDSLGYSTSVKVSRKKAS